MNFILKTKNSKGLHNIRIEFSRDEEELKKKIAAGLFWDLNVKKGFNKSSFEEHTPTAKKKKLLVLGMNGLTAKEAEIVREYVEMKKEEG